jgi:hypothetical protein
MALPARTNGIPSTLPVVGDPCDRLYLRAAGNGATTRPVARSSARPKLLFERPVGAHLIDGAGQMLR